MYKVCISGLTASGKTTLARSLALHFEAQYISTSDLLLEHGRSLGFVPENPDLRQWWISQQAQRFNEYRLNHPRLDWEVDREIAKRVEEAKKPIIVDSRVYPKLRKNKEVFCVYLTAPSPIRAMRAPQNGGDPTLLLKAIDCKDQATSDILHKAWGLAMGAPEYFDLFDLVLDDSQFESPGVDRQYVKDCTFKAVLDGVYNHFNQ